MDRIKQRLGISREGIALPEYGEQELQAWREAELTENPPFGPVFAAKLTDRENPSVGAFAYVDYRLGSAVNVPIRDKTTEEELVNKFYTGATFFGEVDLERFTTMATDVYEIERLMALMNKQAAGVDMNEVPYWFYETLNVAHAERYGDVHIGSHGGDSFTATIERHADSWHDRVDPRTLAQLVNKSLPHLTLSPLSKDDYLRAVQAALPFLPRDWNVAEPQ